MCLQAVAQPAITASCLGFNADAGTALNIWCFVVLEAHKSLSCRFKEDRNLMALAGKGTSHSAGYREAAPEED